MGWITPAQSRLSAPLHCCVEGSTKNQRHVLTPRAPSTAAEEARAGLSRPSRPCRIPAGPARCAGPLNDIPDNSGRETRVREQLAQRGYRLMNRGRRGERWLMYSKPATLDVLEGFLEHMGISSRAAARSRSRDQLCSCGAPRSDARSRRAPPWHWQRRRRRAPAGCRPDRRELARSMHEGWRV
jgi:hypothetical protein